MKKVQWISKEEEDKLPVFKNYEEARTYFEEKYGERFVFEESFDRGEGMCYFYRLIIDEEAYIKGASRLNATGYMGMEFKRSYQPIKIMNNGFIDIGR